MKNKIVTLCLLFFIICESFIMYATLTMTIFSLKQDIFIFAYGTAIPTQIDYYVKASPRIWDAIQLNLNNVETDIGEYKASVSYLHKTYNFKIKVVNKKQEYKLKQIVYHLYVGDTLYAYETLQTKLNPNMESAYFLDNEETQTLIKQKSYNQEGVYVERVLIMKKDGSQTQPLRIKVIVKSLATKEKG